MMTSVIGALFVGSAVWLGWEAWRIGEPTSHNRGRSDPHSLIIFTPSSDYGHLAERLCVMAGFVGTAIGLSLQAKSLAGGATSFTCARDVALHHGEWRDRSGSYRHHDFQS
jgi:hypothetical protein